MIDPLIHYSLLGSFALMFALSAAEKYSDRAAFSAEIQNYRLLPAALIPVIAVLVTATEIIIATLLITELYRYAAIAGMLLLLAYAAGIMINLLRGRTHIDCGCLGSHGEGISYFHVLRNLLMAGLLEAADRQLVWLDYFVVAGWLAAATLVYATASLLLAAHLNHRTWWQ